MPASKTSSGTTTTILYPKSLKTRQDSNQPLRESEKIYLPDTKEKTDDSLSSTSDSDSERGQALNRPPAPDPSQFPDGGARAWLVVSGAWCCLFCSFGWISCIGVFQEYYEEHQLRDYSHSTISWISSLETFMMFFGGAIIGKIYDNHGPRYIVLTGTFFHVFGLMMTSLASEYYQFVLAQGICSSIGASCIFYPALTAIGSWFWYRRAFAYGIIASGASMGGVLLPILVSHVIPMIGFQWTMRVVAFIILGLMIFANLTLKSRIPPKPRPLNIKEFFDPLSEPVFSLVVAAAFLFFLCMFIPINFIIVQAQTEGMSPHLAEYLVPILNAGSLVGRILPSYIADKIGRFNMMICMTYLTSIIVLALWIPSSNNASIIIFSVIYGFGTGAFVSLIPTLTAQITKDLTKLGVRTGTMFAIISVAALIGNPIAGALVTLWNGNFLGMQIFCGVLQLAGASVFVAARIVDAGPRLMTKI